MHRRNYLHTPSNHELQNIRCSRCCTDTSHQWCGLYSRSQSWIHLPNRLFRQPELQRLNQRTKRKYQHSKGLFRQYNHDGHCWRIKLQSKLSHRLFRQHQLLLIPPGSSGVNKTREMKKVLLLLPLLLASCSFGVNIKSNQPFQATCVKNKIETVMTIDPDLEKARVAWTPTDNEEAQETIEIWEVTKLTPDRIVIESPKDASYSPRLRVQLNRNTRQVFVGNAPPRKEHSCIFKRLDV